MNAPLPSRHDEAWRYADLAAVESIWPLPELEQIRVAAGSQLAKHYVLDGSGPAIRQLELQIGARANAAIHVLNIGSGYGRFELTVHMDEGSQFNFGGVQIGGGDANLEIITNVRHEAPGANSHQVVRSVLAGKATGSFLGKIDVLRHAQKTDAEQSVKAMLLDRTATANAKPELEIFADDVKCAHGATVGELDKQALFYLASRGVSPSVAKKLMLQAFLGDAFVSMRDDDARAQIGAQAITALEALA